MLSVKRLTEIGRHVIKCRMPPKLTPASYRELDVEGPVKMDAIRFKYRFHLEVGCEFVSSSRDEVSIASQGANLLVHEIYGGFLHELRGLQAIMYAEDNSQGDAWDELDRLISSIPKPEFKEIS